MRATVEEREKLFNDGHQEGFNKGFNAALDAMQNKNPNVTISRKPLSESEIMVLEIDNQSCSLYELVRSIEKAHGIGVDK